GFDVAWLADTSAALGAEASGTVVTRADGARRSTVDVRCNNATELPPATRNATAAAMRQSVQRARLVGVTTWRAGGFGNAPTTYAMSTRGTCVSNALRTPR